MLRNKLAGVLAVAVVVTLGYVGQAVSLAKAPKDPELKQRTDELKQQVASDRVQGALGMTDDEWKVVQPKIDKVKNLSREVNAKLFKTSGAPRSLDKSVDPNDPKKTSDVEQKMLDLEKLLQDKSTKGEDIKAALASYREVRGKAQTQLQTAEKELRDLLTVRQEATLVTFGILE